MALSTKLVVQLVQTLSIVKASNLFAANFDHEQAITF
jgi:hypothetical protein